MEVPQNSIEPAQKSEADEPFSPTVGGCTALMQPSIEGQPIFLASVNDVFVSFQPILIHLTDGQKTCSATLMPGAFTLDQGPNSTILIQKDVLLKILSHKVENSNVYLTKIAFIEEDYDSMDEEEDDDDDDDLSAEDEMMIDLDTDAAEDGIYAPGETRLCIPRDEFEEFFKQISPMPNVQQRGFSFDASAVEALHEASEAYLSGLMQDSLLVTLHRQGVAPPVDGQPPRTLNAILQTPQEVPVASRDIQLARRIRGERS